LENQQHRAGGLNLLVAAIVIWNAVFTWSEAVQALRNRGQMIPEALLVHLTPLKWEHINLTGDYHWRRDGGVNSPRPPIAVGMPIAEHHAQIPACMIQSTRLPPWVFDREAFARPRMKDTDLR
jgi:Tn3 transposase DDE domain-containing protein